MGNLNTGHVALLESYIDDYVEARGHAGLDFRVGLSEGRELLVVRAVKDEAPVLGLEMGRDGWWSVLRPDGSLHADPADGSVRFVSMNAACLSAFSAGMLLAGHPGFAD